MHPSWKIHRINNATHEVTVKHVDGRKISVTIPEEHRDTHELKMTHLREHTKRSDRIRLLVPIGAVLSLISTALALYIWLKG